MLFEKIQSRFLLIAGLLFLFCVIVFQKPIKNFISFQEERLQIEKDNFFAAGDPKVMKRQRPVSTALLESELQVYVGEPFTAFEDEDWEYFWHLIYGIFPLQQPQKEGLPKKMRQLTKEEIITELRSCYPMPFKYYNQDGWKAVFSIISKKP